MLYGSVRYSKNGVPTVSTAIEATIASDADAGRCEVVRYPTPFLFGNTNCHPSSAAEGLAGIPGEYRNSHFEASMLIPPDVEEEDEDDVGAKADPALHPAMEPESRRLGTTTRRRRTTSVRNARPVPAPALGATTMRSLTSQFCSQISDPLEGFCDAPHPPGAGPADIIQAPCP